MSKQPCRLYLAEEDSAVRQRRKKAGGNGTKQFAEGWIEYADKKLAKTVAESLNNTKVSGRKRYSGISTFKIAADSVPDIFM